MNFFRDLKIGVKIVTGYALALALMAVVGGVALFRLAEIQAKVSNLTGNLSVDLDVAGVIQTQLLRARLYFTRYLRAEDAASLQTYEQEWAKLEAALETAQVEITKPERVAMLDSIRADAADYHETVAEMVALIQARQQIRADVLDVQSQAAQDALNALMDAARADGDVAALYYAGLAQESLQRLRVNMLKFLESGDGQWVDRFADRQAELDQALAGLDSALLDPGQRQTFDAAVAALDAYIAGFNGLHDGYARQIALENRLLNELGPQIVQAAVDMADSVGADFDAEEASTREIVAQTQVVVVAVLALAIMLALGLGVLIARGITRALQALTGAIEQIAQVDLPALAAEMAALAQGDLTRRVSITAQPLDIAGRDETGQMARAFNAMIERLRGIGQAFDAMSERLRGAVGQVADNAQQLASASSQLSQAAGQAGQATGQIATTVQQVARGTAQQSESVTRTATATEQMKRAIDGVARGAQEQAAAVGRVSTLTSEMTAAIQQVAGNAAAVTQESAGAAEAARAGSRTVEETIKGMSSIRAKVGVSAEKVQEMGRRSDQIGTIVEAIDDIASQTNLLALNAAIEAARAGEHGKGFAVVADEVRKLAERASAATKEIGGLIKGIQATVGEAVRAMADGAREVEAGSQLANEAGEALARIMRAAEAVQVQAEAARSATQRMSSLSNDLVGAMDSMSAVVEENTAATEEMAAGAGEVAGAIENIASVSEENSAAVEEVSASAEEMNAQVEEVTASAQSLAEMARALQDVVAQFRLAADGQPGAPVQVAAPPRAAANGRPTNGHRVEKISFN